jgi:Ser/Thr protein kinase RdoA (MazF antagonist)
VSDVHRDHIEPAVLDKLANLVRSLGLDGATLQPVSHNFNYILRLAPHPVVARISRVPTRPGAALADGRRELSLASHLERQGVAVAGPAPELDPGPHRLGHRVVTFWRYIPPTKRPVLAPGELVRRALALETSLASYPKRLPHLGAWRFSGRAIRHLRAVADVSVRRLVHAWEDVDAELARLPAADLRPAHGDAHLENLLPGPDDWYWTDFEDASRMPVFWDLAALVANPFLFKGERSTLWRAATAVPAVAGDRRRFLTAVRARAILGTAANTWWAAAHAGDRPFAERQLAALWPALDRLSAMLL